MSYDVQLIDGDLPAVTQHITGNDLTVQRLEIRLATFLGEWLLDTTEGLRYLEWLQQTPPRVDEIGADLRREVETTPGVVRVDNWLGSFDVVSQTLTFTADVVVDDGTVLSLVVVPPAIAAGNTSAGSIIRIAQAPVVRAF